MPYYVGATYGPRGLAQALAAGGFRVDDATSTLHCPRVLAVPVASMVARRGTAGTRERLARALIGFERLAELPTRYLSGHYVAVRAVKV